MAAWSELESSEPGFAGRFRELFDAHTHKSLATLRKDGSPRISGIEASFIDGDLWFGSMWEARKALDLRRDSRFALHSASTDPPAWKGDAKAAGRAEEITDAGRKDAVRSAMGADTPSGPFHLFRAEITEAVLVLLGDPADHLVIELWRPGRELRRIEKR